MSPQHTLILMRHGKSGYPLGVADHDRPIAPRGRLQAGLAGQWLRATQPPIDAVLCSTALRTRQTLEATGITAPTTFTRELYNAHPAEVLAEITMTDPSVRTLLVVAHHPGMPSTALELSGDPETPEARRIREKFPTSALAVLDASCDWSALTSNSARLSAFHVPR